MARFSSFIFLAIISLLAARAAGSDQTLISKLEKKLHVIDAELSSLAQMSLNSGVGPIGYRSLTYPNAEAPVSVKIDLGQEFRIDEVVLVPALWRDFQSGFVSDGFPVAFKILAGTEEDQEGTLLAEFRNESGIPHGIGPLVIPVSGARASWIKIETSRLSKRAFDAKYIFQLSEVLVFEGEKNVALRKRITPSEAAPNIEVWTLQNLVDGIVPYLMNAAQGPQSRALVAHGPDQPLIEMDLGGSIPLSGIRLHAADQSDTVPQGFSGDFGFPRRFRIEGATKKDFTDSKALLEGEINSLYQVGPMMEWQFAEVACRYVRLIATEPYIYKNADTRKPTIAFAEIELYSKGKNVALGKSVTSNASPVTAYRSLTSLTDGSNLYGKILPFREWLAQLARRQELEAQRPVIVDQLTERYARQKTNLQLMFWLATALALGIGFIVLYYRRRSRRQEALIRERISANLHDNLGANLHAIGLLGDLAKDAIDAPEELIDTVERIRRLTERTGRAARDCANMIEATDVCQDLVAEMKRDSMSFLADLEHDLSFQGEDFLKQLSRRRRIDLFFFYKEALINVIRHSGATSVKTRLVADAKQVCLTVTDNGHGYEGDFPASLQRRTRLLGAHSSVTQSESGGTRITLTLKTQKFEFFK
ncbi:histidine kinase [Akkermansiaceae bacterium]|nr:histidine kinase [Akkermansiaceae bacterium]